MPESFQIKAFLSYSHEDSDYRDALLKHISPLKREFGLGIWWDGEIPPGGDIDDNIESQIGNADLFLSLISSSYIGSDSCINEWELATKYNNKIIVPIIIRPCYWEGMVDNKLALPTDGHPVADWDDCEHAWTNVIQNLNHFIKDKFQGKYSVKDEEGPIRPRLKEDYYEKLVFGGPTFQHRFKEKIGLEDIFVYPDLRIPSDEPDGLDVEYNSENLLADYKKENVVIFGGEQSGKSGLANKIFLDSYNAGSFPVLISGGQVKNVYPESDIEDAVKREYVDIENQFKIDNIDLVILDNVDDVKFNDRYFSVFLENIRSLGVRLILFSDEKIRYNENRYLSLRNFREMEILNFGHVLRQELINKWNSLGQEETIDDYELEKMNDNSKMNLDSVVRRNLVPPKPIFIITILQSLDSHHTSDVSLSTYGHCYQYLVYQALERAYIPKKETDMYINYLTYLGYWVFSLGGYSITEDDLKRFQDFYSDKYIHNDHSIMIQKLESSGLLKIRVDGGIQFSYKYIMYFFAAKCISDNLDDDDVKKYFDDILEKIHLERNANVIIFITHHSKSKDVLERIELKALKTFEKLEVASLSVEDTNHLAEYVSQIPEMVMEERDPEEEREKVLRKKDEKEKELEKKEEEGDGYIEEEDDYVAEIDCSIRMIEIMGEVLRTRYGSMEKGQIKEFSEEAYDLGLRLMRFVLNETSSARDHFVEQVADYLEKNDLDFTDKKKREAQRAFLGFCYSIIYGLLRKIAHSLGNEQVVSVFEEIERERNNPAIGLVNALAKLEFEYEIPKNKIKSLYEYLEGNEVSRLMLKQGAVQHCYLHRVEFKDRQWIASTLSIPINTQRTIQGRTRQIGS